MPEALRARDRATSTPSVVVVSYNDEAWVTLDELATMCAAGTGTSRCSPSTRKRYVGAQIGIHNPKGERVGTVSHLRNTELIVVSGPRHLVRNGTRHRFTHYPPE